MLGGDKENIAFYFPFLFFGGGVRLRREPVICLDAEKNG